MHIGNLNEATVFIETILGKGPTVVFDSNIEELMYYTKEAALCEAVTAEEMQGRLMQLSEGILAASFKKYLDENYMDSNGCLQVNVGNGIVYDKDMNPIAAIGKIHKHQGDLLSILVSFGMHEFSRGRNLLGTIEKNAPLQVSSNIRVSLEAIETEIAQIEIKLPKLSKEEASRLVFLYSEANARNLEPAR